MIAVLYSCTHKLGEGERKTGGIESVDKLATKLMMKMVMMITRDYPSTTHTSHTIHEARATKAWCGQLWVSLALCSTSLAARMSHSRLA